jgi:hypothetical protein
MKMTPIRNALVAAGGAALALSSLTAAAESFGRDSVYAARAGTEPASTAPVDWSALQVPGRQGGLPLAQTLEVTSEPDSSLRTADLPVRFGRA